MSSPRRFVALNGEVYVPVSVAADMLQVESQTIRRWVDRGKLPGFTDRGGCRWILEWAVDEMVDAQMARVPSDGSRFSGPNGVSKLVALLENDMFHGSESILSSARRVYRYFNLLFPREAGPGDAWALPRYPGAYIQKLRRQLERLTVQLNRLSQLAPKRQAFWIAKLRSLRTEVDQVERLLDSDSAG
jgi:hypothetical protein